MAPFSEAKHRDLLVSLLINILNVPVSNLGPRQPKLTEVFRDFPRALQANVTVQMIKRYLINQKSVDEKEILSANIGNLCR